MYIFDDNRATEAFLYTDNIISSQNTFDTGNLSLDKYLHSLRELFGLCSKTIFHETCCTIEIVYHVRYSFFGQSINIDIRKHQHKPLSVDNSYYEVYKNIIDYLALYRFASFPNFRYYGIIWLLHYHHGPDSDVLKCALNELCADKQELLKIYQHS